MTPVKIPGAAALAQEADGHLRALIDALKQQQSRHQAKQQGGGGGQHPGREAAAAAAAAGDVSAGPPPSGPVMIMLVKALSVVAVQRPGLLGRVLPTIITLAKEVGTGDTACYRGIVGGASMVALPAHLPRPLSPRSPCLPRPPYAPLLAQGGYLATGCEEAGPLRSGEVSLGNALKLALTSILRSRTDTR